MSKGWKWVKGKGWGRAGQGLNVKCVKMHSTVFQIKWVSEWNVRDLGRGGGRGWGRRGRVGAGD